MRVLRVLLRPCADPGCRDCTGWPGLAERLRDQGDRRAHLSIVEVTGEYVDLAAFLPGEDDRPPGVVGRDVREVLRSAGLGCRAARVEVSPASW